MQPVIELPGRDQQMDFNRQRWAELSVDPVVAELPFRIETNGHGQILMTPPPTVSTVSTVIAKLAFC